VAFHTWDQVVLTPPSVWRSDIIVMVRAVAFGQVAEVSAAARPSLSARLPPGSSVVAEVPQNFKLLHLNYGPVILCNECCSGSEASAWLGLGLVRRLWGGWFCGYSSVCVPSGGWPLNPL
jgi:hypothetical protein